jgi:hypothetical protein
MAGTVLSSIKTWTGVLLLSVFPMMVSDVPSIVSPLVGETMVMTDVHTGVVVVVSALPTLSESLVAMVSVVRSMTVRG